MLSYRIIHNPILSCPPTLPKGYLAEGYLAESMWFNDYLVITMRTL